MRNTETEIDELVSGVEWDVRLGGNRGALLELLGDRKWHPNYACAAAGGLSFGGSLHALRCYGWLIDSRFIRRGLWEYRLTGKGPPRPRRTGLSGPQERVAEAYETAIVAITDNAALGQVRAEVPAELRFGAK